MTGDFYNLSVYYLLVMTTEFFTHLGFMLHRQIFSYCNGKNMVQFHTEKGPQ